MKRGRTAVTLVGVAAVLVAAGGAAAEGRAAAVELTGATLAVRALVPTSGVYVRVTGPGEFVAERAFGPGDSLALELGQVPLTDGVYQYEVTPAPPDPREGAAAGEVRPRSRVEAGTFRVSGGVIVPPQDVPQAESAGTLAPAGPGAGGPATDIVFNENMTVTGLTCLGAGCGGSGVAPLTLWNSRPNIRFIDTRVGAADWTISANSSSFSADSFTIRNSLTNAVFFSVFAGAPSGALHVSSSGRVGLGTFSPVAQLHVRGDSVPTALRLERFPSSTASDQVWDVAASADGFAIMDPRFSTPREVLKIFKNAPSHSLVINAAGRVGLGTDAPLKALHVTRTDGNAQVRVDETSATTAIRTLMALSNNGPVRFTTANSATGATWVFDNDAGGNFTMNKIGVGAVELSLDGGGNLTIAGALTQGSDRAIKADILAADPQALLEKLAGLPISTWRYKQDAARHIGPMAQDFAAAFGFGADDKHIAPADLAGLSLAAVQALRAHQDALRAEIAAKDAHLRALEGRLQTLEAAVRAGRAAEPDEAR